MSEHITGLDPGYSQKLSGCNTEEELKKRSPVAHYMAGNIETIDYIRDQLTPEQFEGYLRGQIFKYISRYPHKGGVDDLYKAQTYLGWLIELKKC
jgi:hypothetical protein